MTKKDAVSKLGGPLLGGLIALIGMWLAVVPGLATDEDLEAIAEMAAPYATERLHIKKSLERIEMDLSLVKDAVQDLNREVGENRVILDRLAIQAQIE